jgi:hypothetical protein
VGKDRWITVRVSEKIGRIVRTTADLMGLSVSELLRQAILEKQHEVEGSREDKSEVCRFYSLENASEIVEVPAISASSSAVIGFFSFSKISSSSAASST